MTQPHIWTEWVFSLILRVLMRILGIETSCDETALALVTGKAGKVSMERSLVASQIDVHKQFGGVVPEVAARQHAETIPLLLQEIFSDIREEDVDAIAVTAGPGLITSLRVGTDVARALSFAWGKPLVAVNHIEGHIAANWLDEKDPPAFPALALIVSGGHTELVYMKDFGKYSMLGATRDDAVGEAFDKVAKMLELGYPGGPAVAEKALHGDMNAIDFPRPMIGAQSLDFSFSGLKTAVLQHVKHADLSKDVPDICASFQAAVIDVLVSKTLKAGEMLHPKTILLAGGVAANTTLRAALRHAIEERLPNIRYMEPRIAYTTDNAGMIAAAGYFLAQKKKFVDWKKLLPDSQWEIGRV